MPAPLASAHAEPATPGSRRVGSWSRDALPRYLAVAMRLALAVLLVEVLLESWVQELSSDRSIGADGKVVGELANWPKDLKNAIYLLLVALAAATITLQRRWREFTTRADIALVVLAAVMALAGALGTSGPTLIGEAIFVYLRGAVVFYAVRVLRPTWPQVRRTLWIVGAILVAYVLIAVAQTVLGRPAYTGVGIVDAFAARNFRGQGLFHHPNDLGQVLGLVVLGIVAWLTGPGRAPDLDATGRRLRVYAWVGLGLAGAGISASQSRDALAAAVIGVVALWFLRRDGGRVFIASVMVVLLAFAVNIVARPYHLSALLGRLGGVFNAVETPSGSDNCAEFDTTDACVKAGQVEYRELRVLFFQQGARLLAHRPVLGYGVGQFGGIVAEKHDPHWELDPRFPGGFDLHDLDGTTVDSFWLHLTVETGVLGLLAYLAWITLLAIPVLAVTRRFGGRRLWGSSRPRAPAEEPAQTVALWASGAVLLAMIISVFSTGLENPLFPPLVFGVLGLGWVAVRGERHHREVDVR